MSSSLDIFKRIITDTEDIFIRIPITEIAGKEKLNDDLGIDSLGKVNLFYEISDELETGDEEDVAVSWSTVDDVLRYIDENKS